MHHDEIPSPYWWNPLDYWVNVITTSLFSRTLEIIVSKGNHPQMALIQVSEL